MKAYKQKDLLKTDWDVLIVIDACRFDDFSAQNILKGTLKPCWTRATNTQQWYKNYWNEKHKDTILITPNPNPEVVGAPKNFFLFPDFNSYPDKEWYESEPALNTLLEFQKEYDKRFLVHLMPPHLPYIGEKGKKFMNEIEVQIKEEGTYNIYQKVQQYSRKHGFEKAKQCYIENIKEVCKIIKRFLPEIQGKVVVTSDHAEIIGEYGVYNHNIEVPLIHLVPWLEVDKTLLNEKQNKIIKKRLKELGYL